VDGTSRCRTIHLAAKMVIKSMTGVSVSSAILVPTLGTSQSNYAKDEANAKHESEIKKALQLSPALKPPQVSLLLFGQKIRFTTQEPPEPSRDRVAIAAGNPAV
jgi:hypothetical protein